MSFSKYDMRKSKQVSKATSPETLRKYQLIFWKIGNFESYTLDGRNLTDNVLKWHILDKYKQGKGGQTTEILDGFDSKEEKKNAIEITGKKQWFTTKQDAQIKTREQTKHLKNRKVCVRYYKGVGEKRDRKERPLTFKLELEEN